MNVQKSEQVIAVESALVKAGIAKAGCYTDGETFVMSDLVTIVQGENGIAIIWIMAHPASIVSRRRKGEIQRIRTMVEAALAGIEGC